MRAFIAAPLNEQALNELSALQDALRKSQADVKWVEPRGIHLTLKFLGIIDGKQARGIGSSLKNISKIHKPFNMHFSQVEAFPVTLHPRVIWVGVNEGKAESEELQKDIETATERLGFKREDGMFRPHLTLGRVRSEKNQQSLIEILEKEKGFAVSGKTLIDKIILFESKLSSSGPAYTPLAEFPLK